VSSVAPRWLVAACALWAAACFARWDLSALEARYPALASEETARLAEASPYLLPTGDVLFLFFCRWQRARPLQVSLPPDATARERELLERALLAWQQADLGLLFELAPDARGDIEIRFVRGRAARAGSTGADCLVEAPPEDEADALDARLVRASVHLRRHGWTTLGHERAFSDAEILGSAVHELGHALGYQGHARRGDAVMVRSVDRVRRTGEELLAGAPFHDDALHALYALPSGVILRSVALPRGRTSAVDTVYARAVAAGWFGPVIRVGDTAARIHWKPPDRRPLGFVIRELPETLRDPRELLLEPDAAVLEMLASGP
jgi:hypothetical protein